MKTTLDDVIYSVKIFLYKHSLTGVILDIQQEAGIGSKIKLTQYQRAQWLHKVWSHLSLAVTLIFLMCCCAQCYRTSKKICMEIPPSCSENTQTMEMTEKATGHFKHQQQKGNKTTWHNIKLSKQKCSQSKAVRQWQHLRKLFGQKTPLLFVCIHAHCWRNSPRHCVGPAIKAQVDTHATQKIKCAGNSLWDCQGTY